MAEIGTPFGSSHSGAMEGTWERGVVNRLLGCVGEDRRAGQSLDRGGVGLDPSARCDAEHAKFGVDPSEPTVTVEPHRADAVTDGLGLPTGDGRYHCRIDPVVGGTGVVAPSEWRLAQSAP
jgi:hypothetical protein